MLSKKATIFGGSSPREGDEAYQNAFILGKLLAQKGIAVITGGYIGTMEASSKGAFENHGDVIGLTCDEIETWRPVKPNKYITYEIRSKSLIERLNKLIEMPDILIALPGGIGTLAEISTAWSRLQVKTIKSKPLILVGEEWKNVFLTLFENLPSYISNKDKALISFASNISETMLLVDEYFSLKA